VADVRNDELFVVIQEIARLRPDIFIIENVPGMKRDRDGDGEGVEVGNFAVEGIRRLRGLDYQIRLVQLDARSFGSPQNRNRLFIICARKGVPLPSIPEPTHTNPVLKVNNFFSSGAITHRPFYVGSKGAPGSGPLAAITVRDAISDLPRWEYIHDGAQSRQIPRFIAHPGRDGPTRVGFLKPVPYAHSSTNDYQKAQRGSGHKVSQHYTPPKTDRELNLYAVLAVFDRLLLTRDRVIQAHISADPSIPGTP
jgi:DNA (cytosine-5)-methyltransferase 1